MNKDIIILLSGGMDSATALYEYQERIRLALIFKYGSKHSSAEVAAAKKLCAGVHIPHQEVDLDLASMGFISALLEGGADIPKGTYNEANMQQTVVPFRNGIMLSIAAGLAESLHCHYVLLSNHAGDHAIYPDCRPAFVDAMAQAIALGTYEGVQLLAPYTQLSKRDIALRGHRLNVPYHLTWSCYQGGSVHCGSCTTCQERKEALKGFDPTRYLD